jgi:dihydrofolate reductase
VRKIIVTMWTTLDGFVAGPDDEMDWLRLDDDVQTYEIDLVGAADTLLLGRVTFNDFAGYWPRVARNSAEQPASSRYAQILDGMEKIAVSGSGQLTEWENTRRWPSVDTDTVLDLKNSPGRDVIVYGSLSLVNTLTELGLVDEFHLTDVPFRCCPHQVPAYGSALTGSTERGVHLEWVTVSNQIRKCQTIRHAVSPSPGKGCRR